MRQRFGAHSLGTDRMSRSNHQPTGALKMKTILIAAALATAAMIAASPASAATQQEKMKSCSADAKAKSLKGTERRELMSQCLAASPEEKAQRLAQKEKTRACTDEAKSKALRGDERKQFVASCVGA
jgi:hypothetical protein